MVEEWINIIGYRFYQISNFGRVKSLSRQIVDANKSYVLQERILIIRYMPYGHVVLRENNKSKTFRIHRLVAKAFIPNIECLPQVNHKDGNKQNNHVDNLEWVTCSGNLKHSYDIGLRVSPMKGRVGIMNIKSKRVYQYKDKILISEFESACLAAKYTGNSHSSISKVCRGEKPSLKGFIWNYTPLT